MKSWYAIHTKPRKEPFVAQLLESRQVEHYLPLVHATPAYRKTSGPSPFFPGYLFARVDPLNTQAARLQWLPGVRGVVEADGQPVTVPDPVIERLQERLAELNDAQRQRSTAFRNGERVVIVRGPFAGYEGLFDTHLSGAERVRILLRLLTQPRMLPLELNASDLKRATT